MPVDRARVAARAAASHTPAKRRNTASPSDHRTVGTDLKLRIQTEVKEYAWTGTRRHGNKRASSDKGQRGEWHNVATFGRHGGEDMRWSSTVTNMMTLPPAPTVHKLSGKR